MASFEDVEDASGVKCRNEVGSPVATSQRPLEESVRSRFHSLWTHATELAEGWARSAKKEIMTFAGDSQPTAQLPDTSNPALESPMVTSDARLADNTNEANELLSAQPSPSPPPAPLAGDLPPPPEVGAHDGDATLPDTIPDASAASNALQAPAPRNTVTSPTSMPEKAPVGQKSLPRLGQFEISDTLLGEGGYGRVMLARHVETNERVAVKTVIVNSPNAVMREIAAMRRAGAHDNICALQGYFSGRDGRTFTLVLELCSGGELYAKVDHNGALPEVDAWRYFCGILNGVRHLHTQGVAHRDIKLENILLGGPMSETPKVCDFGLAHVYQRTPDGSNFENPSLSQWCGSRSYCPPGKLPKTRP